MPSLLAPNDLAAGQPRASSARPLQEGFALLEVLVGAGLILIGLVGLITTTSSGLRLVATNHDTVVAVQTARQVAENLKNYDAVPFDKVFATYNKVATDDPNGIGTATGSLFQALNLKARVNDADGCVGEILFPAGVSGATLREDVCGRDLNGDGNIDSLDHAADYKVLPVTIRLAWTSAGRPRAFELQTLLSKR